MKKLLLAILIFGVSSSQAYSGTVSFDQLAVSSDLTATKYNSDLNRIYQKVNSNVQTDNIANDTITKADFADEADPGLFMYESGGSGTECEMVYTGLLPTTTSGTLTGSVPSGTAYVRGYRVYKSSSTPKTWTASKWTYVDLDQNGDFQYQEVAIGGVAPSVSSNSIRLAKVSSDGTEVNAVQDLRTLNCTSATFSSVKEDTSEGSLQNMMQYGTPVRQSYAGGTPPQGYVQGLNIKYDTHTNFIVTAGAAYIDGSYRYLAADLDIPTSTDDPTNGTSGIVGGALAASTTYKIYAVADQDSVPTLSISFGTAATGLTTYREIGEIRTDATTLFTSSDISSAHSINKGEVAGGWCVFNGTGTAAILHSYNVSSITDNGTGDYTVTWDTDFAHANYAVSVSSSDDDVGTIPNVKLGTAIAVGSVTVYIQDVNDLAGEDSQYVSVVGIGD